jgi:hypothetical protein
MAEPQAKRFRVALSFAGENRGFVEQVAERLRLILGPDAIFYDNWYEPELARLNLDTYLQRIYHDEAELIVLFLCRNYTQKEWCGLEWRAIRDLIKRKQDNIMPCIFENVELPGFLSIDGYLPLKGLQPIETADCIVERLERTPGSHRRARSISMNKWWTMLGCISLIAIVLGLFLVKTSSEKIVLRVNRFYQELHAYHDKSAIVIHIKAHQLTATLNGSAEFFYEKPNSLRVDLKVQLPKGQVDLSLWTSSIRTIILNNLTREYIEYPELRRLNFLQSEPSSDALKDFVAMGFRGYLFALSGTNMFPHVVGWPEVLAEKGPRNGIQLRWNEELKAARTGGGHGRKYIVPIQAEVRNDGLILATVSDLSNYVEYLRENADIIKVATALNTFTNAEVNFKVSHTDFNFRPSLGHEPFEAPDLKSARKVQSFPDLERLFEAKNFNF